ncbi:DUF421 domain-containing protein [Piscinibacter sp. HJYY11]|uniref:DUF421 domain-containing protein n=1 Tax=Piscinibacter sp. HJYY11 TaxID=2801333 RepID=UPI00191E84BA|nr:YetF domain-containing protein [Piscinibacter sp. HJYY11]MBL0728856.1 DUF421 domain-containing protein [Piscinibacter sp. HJYY11]
MFDLSVPWWEFVARAAIVYLVLMVMVRIAGKRTIGQFTPFDLIVVMLLSESVSNALSADDHSVTGGLIVAGTLVFLNVVFAVASARSRKVEQITEGTPVLVGRDGKLFEDVLKRERVGIGELEKALRENDCELADLKYAFLESDGNFSIQKKPG